MEDQEFSEITFDNRKAIKIGGRKLAVQTGMHLDIPWVRQIEIIR